MAAATHVNDTNLTATLASSRSPNRQSGGRERFDAVVVGGRCAGATTGMLLARAGLRVLIVDRSSEGSDLVSGCMIKPDGVARLDNWGILPDLLATGCPPITAAEIVLAGQHDPRAVPPGTLPPIAPRRNILDRLLQQHARRAGAQIQYRTSFRDWRDGVVTLDRHQVRTRLLIGADGRHSKVADVVHAPYQELRPGRSCAWYAYWDGARLDHLRAELRTGIFAGAFPTHASQVLAFTQLPTGAWRHDRGGDDYLAGLSRCPTISDALTDARLSSRVIGARNLPTYFRQAADAGWALVGDAAHHKDPLAARGIADALLSAQLLAEHVLRGWDQNLDQALHRYATALTSLMRPTAELNYQLAGLDLPAEQAHTTWHALQAAEQHTAAANRQRAKVSRGLSDLPADQVGTAPQPYAEQPVR
jgi:flavin-dependent dehydrogenase